MAQNLHVHSWSPIVKQACVLATTPFSMMFFAMLSDANPDNEDGVNLRCGTDINLFQPKEPLS